MITDEGTFLVDINQFIAQIRELESILQSYEVSSVSQLKQKIDRRELPEHPTYEDYLDALHLFDSLKEKKSIILQNVEGVNLDKYE